MLNVKQLFWQQFFLLPVVPKENERQAVMKVL